MTMKVLVLYFPVSEKQVESRVSLRDEWITPGYSWPKRAGQYLTLLLCFQG